MITIMTATALNALPLSQGILRTPYEVGAIMIPRLTGKELRN